MRTVYFIICMFAYQVTLCQTDWHRIPEDVKLGQMKTVTAIINALELGKVETAAQYFDSTLLELNNNLKIISSEVARVKSTAKLSIVIVFEEGFYIYRCRYYEDIGELKEVYQVDLYIPEGGLNSLVKKLETKNSDTLDAERKQRLESNSPPIPPPH